MLKYILQIFIPIFLFAKTSFITPMEYASQLYKNPRGIGCQSCHGKDGEGKIVATYMHKTVKKTFAGPTINNIKYPQFYKKLNIRNKGMPRYFLTTKEIKALYLYLHRNDRKKDINVK